MRRKTVGIIIAILVLVLVGCLGWNLRDLPQKRLIHAAEEMVFTDVDSAVSLLAQVDTTQLTENSQMLFDLMRALVHEEQWYLHYADTASCLSSDTATWSFKREVTYQISDDQAFPDDSTLLRVYHYYDGLSLGGTSDEKEVLRHFGRICFVLSRHSGGEVPLLKSQKLLHLAIHCAEASGDHPLAYRAYSRFAEDYDISYRNEYIVQHWCLRHAMEHYRQSPHQTSWLLTMLNSYGRTFLSRAPCDLHHFPTLVRATSIVEKYRTKDFIPSEACDSVYQCLDSLWALPSENFSYMCALSRGFSDNKKTKIEHDEISVDIVMYEEVQQEHKEDKTKSRQPSFESETKRKEQMLAIDRDTYLAPGYVQKASVLQRRLMTTAIIILVLTVLILLLVFRGWRNGLRRKHEAEQLAHQRKAEHLAERLKQKDTMIEMLRGHILDKSEILEMLKPTEGKRTIINARNWREIEMTLDTVDGDFVSRLRVQYPQFSEEDIRLCMLTRLKLSNTALSALYVISVSAVQHRKQKLKKEGFGVNDPNVTLDQIIANY